MHAIDPRVSYIFFTGDMPAHHLCTGKALPYRELPPKLLWRPQQSDWQSPPGLNRQTFTSIWYRRFTPHNPLPLSHPHAFPESMLRATQVKFFERLRKVFPSTPFVFAPGNNDRK